MLRKIVSIICTQVQIRQSIFCSSRRLLRQTHPAPADAPTRSRGTRGLEQTHRLLFANESLCPQLTEPHPPPPERTSSGVRAGCSDPSARRAGGPLSLPGPQLTHRLRVHKPDLGPAVAHLLLPEQFLSLWAPLFHTAPRRRFNAFPSCHPKPEHSRLSFSVRFFTDFSLPVTRDAESSTQLGARSSACGRCSPPQLQPPRSTRPSHVGSSSIPTAAYSCALPAKLALTVTTSNQVPLKTLIT